jgi:uncharacterized cupredoxin-like copper-binding protein
VNARFASLALASSLLLSAFVVDASAAPQVVGIKLEDSSTGNGITNMRIVLDHDTVKPGRVTLRAVNTSKDLVHEVLVVADTGKPLPIDAKEGRVNEKRIHSLGEISDLQPGKSGKLTLSLKAGKYLLFCNQPGHFEAGMKTTLTVAP